MTDSMRLEVEQVPEEISAEPSVFPTQFQPEIEVASKKGSKWLWILAIFLMLGAGLVWFLVWKETKSVEVFEISKIEVTPSPAATATATPEAEVALSKYSIKILNGSGIAGEATRMKTLLEAAGFTVLSTGNADSYDFMTTEITYSPEVSSGWLSKLKTELAKKYVIKEVVSGKIAGADVEIVVGSSKAE